MELEEYYSHQELTKEWIKLISDANVDQIRSFLEQHPNIINLILPCGATALYLASQNGQEEVVKLLLSHHADTRITSYLAAEMKFYTPLMKALENGHFGAFNALTEAKASGAGIKTLDKKYASNMLVLSAQHGKEAGEKVAKICLKIGANINALHSKEGFSAIHIAVHKKHMNMVEFLLSEEAKTITRVDLDLNLQTSAGRVPLDFAALNHQIECMRLLLKNGADPNLVHPQLQNIVNQTLQTDNTENKEAENDDDLYEDDSSSDHKETTDDSSSDHKETITEGKKVNQLADNSYEGAFSQYNADKLSVFLSTNEEVITLDLAVHEAIKYGVFLVEEEHQKYLKQVEEVDQERNSSNVVTISFDEHDMELFEYYGEPYSHLYINNKNLLMPFDGGVNAII